MADITVKKSRNKNYKQIYYMLNFIQQSIDYALILTYYAVIEENYTDICSPLSEISSDLKKHINNFETLMKSAGIKYTPPPIGEACYIKDIVQNLSTICRSVFSLTTATLQNSGVEELYPNYVLVYFVLHYVQKILSFFINEENGKKRTNKNVLKKCIFN